MIDSSYLEVIDTLKYRPFLLKPNDSELAAFFNYEGEMTAAKTVELAQKLIKLGCQNVLVSLGADGAAFINKHHVLFANAPQIQVVNSACAGDTMLGTFIAFWKRTNQLVLLLKWLLPRVAIPLVAQD